MKLKTFLIMFFILIILVILLVFSFSYWINYNKESKILIDKENDLIINCQDLNLPESSSCVHKNILTIFKYNKFTIGKQLTFEELKDEGGSCLHYSQLYKNSLEKLGFEVRLNSFIAKGEKIGHTFALAYDKDYYCILDQSVKPYCLVFGTD